MVDSGAVLVDAPGEFRGDDAGVGDADEDLAWFCGGGDGEVLQVEVLWAAGGVEADGFH